MRYIALLRVINISGKNKIAMPELKKFFEELGFLDVVTYINSGNVIFSSNNNDKTKIIEIIQNMIVDQFQLNIPVTVVTKDELKDIIDNAPKWWGTDDKEIYDNTIFVINPTTVDEVYNTIGKAKEGLEKISDYKNVIYWSFNLKTYQKTNWFKLASTSVNEKVTIRTANTIKKLLQLAEK